MRIAIIDSLKPLPDKNSHPQSLVLGTLRISPGTVRWRRSILWTCVSLGPLCHLISKCFWRTAIIDSLQPLPDKNSHPHSPVLGTLRISPGTVRWRRRFSLPMIRILLGRRLCHNVPLKGNCLTHSIFNDHKGNLL